MKYINPQGIFYTIILGISLANPLKAQDYQTCSQLYIDLSAADAKVKRCERIEQLSLKFLERDSTDLLSKKVLDVTIKDKKKTINKRDKILRKLEREGCE